MADNLVFSAELDENIRNIMRSLKSRMAATGIAREVDDADIQEQHAVRAREVLFRGLYPDRADTIHGRLPNIIVDGGWINRYNQAIAAGNQDQAMKILVDKEDSANISWKKPYDSMTLSWYRPNNVAGIKYCRLWYRHSTSGSYNGAGLFLKQDGGVVYSPLIVDIGDLTENGGVYSVELYGYIKNKDFFFKIEYVDYSGVVVGSTVSYIINTKIRDVKYYKIHYKSNLDSNTYDGFGLSVSPGVYGQGSPINVSINTDDSPVTFNGNDMSLRIYGNMANLIYKFAVQAVYSDDSVGDIIPIKVPIWISWARPNLVGLEKYNIVYSLNDITGVPLFDADGVALDNALSFAALNFSNANAPSVTFYSDMKNVVYKFDIYAVDVSGNNNFVTTISVGEERRASRNEYCELSKSKDDGFNDYDRVNALLWYLNYVFFIENKNWWAVFQMIEERKRRNTIFPITSPWYFAPKLAGAWERQNTNEHYVVYYEQELKIPLYCVTVLETGIKTVKAAELKVNQNLIDETIVLELYSGNSGLVLKIIAGDISEEYSGFRTISGLTSVVASRPSSVFDIVSVDEYKDCELMSIDMQTFKRKELKVTRPQENIFTFAYYGNTRAVQDIDVFSLDLAAERRIRMEKWENTYNQWMAIQDSVMQTWLQILETKPIGTIIDIAQIIRIKLAADKTSGYSATSVGAASIFEVDPIMREGEVPEPIMHRIVDIIKEDDTVTDTFLQYMSEIYAYLGNLSVYGKTERPDDKPMNVVMDRKAKTLAGDNGGVQLDILRLPQFWDLQKISLLKFDDASYWKDIAEFNDIGNPLDDVEMYEGRLIGLPRLAEDRVTPIGG
jgi:hypothetical protein